MAESNPYKHVTVEDDTSLTKYCTKYVYELMKKCLIENDCVTIGMSGGSSPKQLYENMSKFKDIDWNRVFLFLIDDRYVCSTHKDSNQNLVINTLVSKIKIPPKNVIFPNTSVQMTECVDNYEKDIRNTILKCYPNMKGKAVIDLAILGMGGDGHFASLFPPLSDKQLYEEKKIVMETIAPKNFAVQRRITVTLNFILKSCKKKLFLLKNDKKEIFSRLKKEYNEIHKFKDTNFEKFKRLEIGKSVYFPVLPLLNDANTSMVCVNF